MPAPPDGLSRYNSVMQLTISTTYLLEVQNFGHALLAQVWSVQLPRTTISVSPPGVAEVCSQIVLLRHAYP